MTKNANAKLKMVTVAAGDTKNLFAHLKEEIQEEISDLEKQGWTIKKDKFWSASKNFGQPENVDLEDYQSIEGLLRDIAATDAANAEIAEKAKSENIVKIDTNLPETVEEQLEAQKEVIEDFVKDSLTKEVDLDFSEVTAQRKLDEEREAEIDAESEGYLDRIHALKALKMPIPKDARIFENCAVTLTKEEKAILSADSMTTLNKLDEVNRQLASVKAQYNAEIKELTAKSTRLRHIVTSGFEYRDVECFERFDLEKNQVRIIRKDTFKLVRTREMTAKERQRTFF